MKNFEILVTLGILLISGCIQPNSTSINESTISNKTITEESSIMIPENVIEISNQYIIDKVGENYFKQNYRFLLEQSLPDEKDYESGYFNYALKYEYLPLSHITDDPPLIVITLHSTLNATPSGFVACMDNGVICEPTITKQKALDIVEKNNFNISKIDIKLKPPDFIFFKYYTGIGSPINIKSWYWDISIPISSGDTQCFSYQKIYIDAVTGSLYKLGTSTACM